MFISWYVAWIAGYTAILCDAMSVSCSVSSLFTKEFVNLSAVVCSSQQSQQTSKCNTHKHKLNVLADKKHIPYSLGPIYVQELFWITSKFC